jgi:hypothetical protein
MFLCGLWDAPKINLVSYCPLLFLAASEYVIAASSLAVKKGLSSVGTLESQLLGSGESAGCGIWELLGSRSSGLLA